MVDSVENWPVLEQNRTIVKSKGYLVPIDGGSGIKGVRPTVLKLPPARKPPTIDPKGYLVPIDGGGGIKGVRPPVLKPPPARKPPTIDLEVSSWDFLRHLGPTSETNKRPSSTSSSSGNGFDEEEATEGETEERFVQLGDTADEACSFTTNEDDSSSTVPNCSPICLSGSIITSWQKGQLLGRGSFGFVYEGISGDGDFFAVKEVSLLDQGSVAQESIQQLEWEIALLSQLQHQNIVRYRGTAKDASNLYIFLEPATQGSLLKLYQRYQLMDSQVSLYTRQILDGLNYLHEKGFIHRDIKCANILVDASGVVKLADFGLAKVSKLNNNKSCKGTPFWMAPEVINLKLTGGYGNRADIWSLGCTVLEMLTRQIPYSHLEPVRALFQIGRGNLPSLPDTLSPDARDFILKCLKVNPLERLSAAELLNHPFLTRKVKEGNNTPTNIQTASSSSNILSGTIDQPRMDLPIYVIEKLFKQLEEKLDFIWAEVRTVDSNISISHSHQVFISFRGEQLRNNFISHLVGALRRKMINVFIDKQENKGEDISNLLKRIEDSRIAIVVFSSKYTESKWCLREAETIMERAVQGKLNVLPIFYKVTPMNVKQLKGEFGDNFRDREREYRNDESLIKKWKKSLAYIAGKIGIELNDQSDEYDSIASIVNEVMRMLTNIPLETQTAYSGVNQLFEHRFSLCG